MKYIIIDDIRDKYESNKKKKVFKKWLTREIEYVEWIISTYDENEEEERRYIKNDKKRIKKAKKYMKTFDKNIDGQTHINNLLKILDIYNDVWADYVEKP